MQDILNSLTYKRLSERVLSRNGTVRFDKEGGYLEISVERFRKASPLARLAMLSSVPHIKAKLLFAYHPKVQTLFRKLAQQGTWIVIRKGGVVSVELVSESNVDDIVQKLDLQLLDNLVVEADDFRRMSTARKLEVLRSFIKAELRHLEAIIKKWLNRV